MRRNPNDLTSIPVQSRNGNPLSRYPHHDRPRQISRTSGINHFLMAIHTAHAEPIGELIHEGRHKPFRALACPIGPSHRLAIWTFRYFRSETKTQLTGNLDIPSIPKRLPLPLLQCQGKGPSQGTSEPLGRIPNGRNHVSQLLG